MRQFPSGAIRTSSEGKINPEGCMSPLVIVEFSKFMKRHCVQDDGKTRTDDNWQKGFPLERLAESLQRHDLDFWLLHRGYRGVYTQDILEALCSIKFNVNCYMHELLKEKDAVQKTKPD